MNVGDKVKTQLNEHAPVYEILALKVIKGVNYAWLIGDTTTCGFLAADKYLIPYVEPIKVGDKVGHNDSYHNSNVAGEVIQLFTHGNTDYMVVLFPGLGYQVRVVSNYKRVD